MRLSTCVALELLIGASLVSGLGVSVTWGVREARDHWQREAQAAAASRSILANQLPAHDPEGVSRGDDPVGITAPVMSARIATRAAVAGETGLAESDLAIALTRPGEAADLAGLHDAEGSGLRRHDTFNGVRDEVLLAPLRDAAITHVRFNRGGSSISLRIDFDNGARAAFKPEQAAPQTVPRKEIAAYRIDRLLGLGAVPPAIGRALPADELLAAVVPGSQVFLPRLKEEMRIQDGMVPGELSWWIPIIDKAKIDGYEIDTTDGIVTWKRYLSVGKDMPEDQVSLLAQISSMVLFDFIINNPDRWSGANARVSEDGSILYFMDNTMSFGPDGEGHRKCRIYIRRSQKFSRSLVAALRALTIEEVSEAVAHDKGPFPHLLSELEIEMLMKRRDYALAYIDELIAEHGESAVLVFP
jgi:hypothetical protein